MNPLPVLIVDDEPDICELLSITLTRLQQKSISANSVEQAIQLLQSQKFSLCLTDMRLPDGSGLDVLKHVTHHTPSTPVAVITAHGNMDTAIEALKLGAFDFLSKPVQLEQLKAMISAVTDLPISAEETLINQAETRLIGKSEVASTLRKTLLKVARSQAPVFINGESGAGKEVCAQIIHEHSARKNGPFIAVNCGAIPTELVESEFFGHKKGSFTGAISDKPGLFFSADGGTLLLDEIADLPLSMQVKLLRAIQEKSVRAIGSNSETPIDVRIVSATHKNLQQLVKENLFRNDLFYRINVIEIIVPPLRERTDDIESIAQHILQKIIPEKGDESYGLTPAAITALKSYPFPGNIRELENTLERTIAFSDSTLIDADDLIFQSDNLFSQALDTPSEELQNTEKSIKNTSESKVDDFNPAIESLDDYLQAIEKKEIMAALTRCRWNKTETAKYLGISFRSLRYRLKKLDLED